ncbi:MAG: ABC transporter permease [Theionarchaea archaeon]|nr:ABC transporter permease [Theionarchaea archaeon]MBU7037310.1 ABC transporter permease [Theionarchaea archaeon]
MKEYVLKRLAMLVVVLFGVSIITFVLVRAAPGDPAVNLAGEHATAQVLEQIREKYHLDKPIYEQYLIWIEMALKGDLGRSIKSRELVTVEIVERLPTTLELSIFAMIIASFFGILAGIVSAVRQYSPVDYGVMFGALFGVSMPVFWLGLMMLFIFGVKLGVLPIGGRLTTGIYLERITGLNILDSILTFNGEAFLDSIKHLILPSVALATIPMATIARMTRSSMLEVLRQDYIRTERAKGLSERVVVYKHAIRNALIPIVTVIGMNVGLLMGGAVLTETIFTLPGLGKYIADAILAYDYPVIQGFTLFFATAFVIINLATDIIYVYIDPRIKYK